ncbi:phd zinc finger-containing protein-related [Anaeramoeba flamelloides]|uniref:Phd zinc finger-containing protein-related n=1 Tax=Anaeramoeba flamelloides TaxID=1746091 RepID=A0ABQ8Y941_9EUKA|nr:phd zinc finger-containing protein-related [Anaeramoeba flamelloides]
MSIQTSLPLEKREKLIYDFSIELGCERAEALKYLSCGNFDYSSSIGLFILTRLLSKNNKQSPFTKVPLPEKMRIQEIIPSDECEHEEQQEQEQEQEQEQQEQQEQEQNCMVHMGTNTNLNPNIISLENKDHLTFGELSIFLMTNPSPSWRQRLIAFKLYDPTLLSGFPDALETKKRIVIDKRLFVIYHQINQGVVSSKNLQRGVITYLERIGFLKINDRSRKRMVFNWGEN